jgi:hypothetical protein
MNVPSDGTPITVRYAYGGNSPKVNTVNGICDGVMPGKRSGTQFDRAKKLIVTINADNCQHIPLDWIKEIKCGQ